MLLTPLQADASSAGLMGYSFGALDLGFIDAGRDPISAIRPELEAGRSRSEHHEVDRLERPAKEIR
jgi:hypothetical protein